MGLEYRSCTIEHIKLIDAVEYQKDDKEIFLRSGGAVLDLSSFAVSVWDGSRCIGAGGILPVHTGTRAIAWSLFGKGSGKHLAALKRAASRHLRWEPTRRIEFYISEHFRAGHRWAKMLGFKCETPDGMEAHGPSGEKQYLYARIK